MTRVLVCGGRDYSWETALAWLRDRGGYEVAMSPTCRGPVSCVIHGGARGADMAAAPWASDLRARCEAFHADWEAHGRAAGPIRNARMLWEGRPDVVIAFPGGSGTADMVAKARRAGVTVIEVTG